MIISRTIVVADPLARANVCELLAGRGAPAGVTSCSADGQAIVVLFDDERTSTGLIDAIVSIATVFVPDRGPAFSDRAVAIAGAARGLNEPALDMTRVIETYLP